MERKKNQSNSHLKGRSNKNSVDDIVDLADESEEETLSISCNDGKTAFPLGLEENFHSTMEINESSESEDDSSVNSSPIGTLIEDEVRYDLGEFPHMRTFDERTLYRKLNSDSVLVSITPLHSLYFSGKCLIRIVRGKVDIYGYEMSPKVSKQYVFSPKGHSSLLCIKSMSKDGVIEKLDEEINAFVTLEELSSLPGAVVIMQAFDNEWAEGMRNFSTRGDSLIGPCPTGIGPSSLPLMNTFVDKLGFQFIPQGLWKKNRLFNCSLEWNDVFDRIHNGNQSKTIIFGGQATGKSNLSRWMVNKILSKPKSEGVLFLDIDPGQTEFNPPGVLSASFCNEPLLGPNFTHLRQTSRSVFLGGTNVADFPISYINALVQLFEFVSNDERFVNIPWIINTMGFSQGLGVNLAASAIKIFKPSFLIQLSINNDRRSFPFDLKVENIRKQFNEFLEKHLAQRYKTCSEYTYFKIESVCNIEERTNANPWGKRPKDLREDVMISYFSELIGSTKDYNFKSIVPINVSLEEVAIGTMNSELAYDGIIKSFLGNLVALCEFSPECLAQSELKSYNGAAGVPKRMLIKKAQTYQNIFHGYGVVRAYDEKQGVLHIVTPLENEILRGKVNAIIGAGNIGLPIQFLTSNNASNSSDLDVPYVMKIRDSSLHAAPRKYFAPKKVTHPVLRNSLL